MKKVKIIMAMYLFTGVAITGFAQKTEKRMQMDPEARANKEVEMISNAVPDLSEQQKKQIKEASLEQHKSMLQLREERRENNEAFREKMKDMRTAKRESYKKILNKDQYIQLLEKRQEHEGRKGRKGMHYKRGKDFKGKNDGGERGPRR